MEFQLLTGSIELYYILKEKKTLFICSYLLSHIVDKYRNYHLIIIRLSKKLSVKEQWSGLKNA